MGALAGLPENALQHRNETRPDRMDAAVLESCRNQKDSAGTRGLQMKGKANGHGSARRAGTRTPTRTTTLWREDQYGG